MLCAACLLGVTVTLVRRGLLTSRYALGWSTLALVAFFGGPVLGLLSERIGFLGLTQTGFSLGIILLFLTAICVQLSISLSGLIASTRDLSESVALLRERVEGRTPDQANLEVVGSGEADVSFHPEVAASSLVPAEKTPAG